MRYGRMTKYVGQHASVLEPTPTQRGWVPPESNTPSEFTVFSAEEDDKPLLYFYVGSQLFTYHRRTPAGFL